METFIILLNVLLVFLIVNYFFIKTNTIYETMACSTGKQNKVAKQSAQTNRLYGEVNRMKSMYGLLNVKSNTNRQLIQANKSKNRGAIKNIDKERKKKESELNKLDKGSNVKAPKTKNAKSAQKFGDLLENSPDST
jgi:hypothetical protein